MWCFLIFGFLMLLGKRFKHKGDCFLWYAMLYAFERMLVEGLRQDSLYIGGIRVSQALSAVIFLAIAAFMIWRAVKEKRTGTLVGELPYFATAAYAEELAAEADDGQSAEAEAPAAEEPAAAESQTAPEEAEEEPSEE